jgi:3-oxoacyl-[acyl-carrier protein] reductase
MSSKKTVFVMGSSSGIGNALVNHFLKQGWGVYAGSSNPDKVGTKPHLKVIPLDLKKISSIEAIYAVLDVQVQDTMDAVVCVSGVSAGGDFTKFTLEEWQESMNINLLGPTLMARYFIAQAQKNSHPLSIVFTSSLSAFKGANKPQYAASKAALSGISSSVARKFGTDKIRSNIVVPGVVETNLVADWDETKKHSIVQTIPLGRFASVQEVVNLLYFLASDESAYINGQIIHISGGDLM